MLLRGKVREAAAFLLTESSPGVNGEELDGDAVLDVDCSWTCSAGAERWNPRA